MYYYRMDTSGTIETKGDDNQNIDRLNDKWIFWFHDPLDNNWKINSYRNITDIVSIQDFWKLYNNLEEKIIENSMLFLMRHDIEPLWEHSRNVNGGCWSIKISKDRVYEIWKNISMALLGENISNNDLNKINGISISPKKSFCIIKIWNDKKENKSVDLLKKIENISYEGVIYKPHNKY